MEIEFKEFYIGDTVRILQVGIYEDYYLRLHKYSGKKTFIRDKESYLTNCYFYYIPDVDVGGGAWGEKRFVSVRMVLTEKTKKWK